MGKNRGDFVFRIVVAASLLLTVVVKGIAPASAASIKNGESCSPVGSSFKQAGVTFICTKSGSEDVWKSKKKPAPKPTAEEFFVMPKVVGLNLQLAQDLLQSKGSYILDQEDFKGLNRLQLLDSNWKVCAQWPASGKKVVISTVVRLSSVKLTENC